MDEVKVCIVCGKQIEDARRKIYCSDTCKRKKRHEEERAEYKKIPELPVKKRMSAKQRRDSMNKIAKAARDAGMSYGYYVALQAMKKG